MCVGKTAPRRIEDTSAAWVPDYFGDEYLRLYQFPEERTGPEVAFLTRELAARIPSDGRVLDLACGQGRHAVRLAAAGFRMVGLDYQANLLAEARRAANDAGVDLALVRGDMRRLPFANRFDAVLNLFSAFGYFSDAENAGVLREVARVLRPGGWFVQDVANRDWLLRHAQPDTVKTLPNGAVVRSTWRWDVPTGRYTHRQEVIAGERTRVFTHGVRVYTCTELTAMIADAGLSVDALHGGFRGEPLDWDAPRLVVIAQKRA